MIPAELDNRAKILAAFSSDFDVAKQAIELALKLLDRLAQTNRRWARPVTKAMALNILAREIRRYVAITEMAEFGLLENVGVLSRVLFEGLLAERYIFCKPRPLSKCSPDLQRDRRLLPRRRTSFDHVEFRSHLYFHYHAIRLCSISRGIRLSDGDRTITDEMFSQFETAAREAESMIGPRWARIQRQKRSYSGLTIELLAEMVGLKDVHRSFYRIESIHTHAVDAMICLSPEGENTITTILSSDVKDLHQLPTRLRYATIFLGILLQDLNKAFRLGFNKETRRLFLTLQKRTGGTP